MSLLPDIDNSAVLAAVRAFLLGVLPPEVEVVKAQGNGVPMPAGEFVAMTPGRVSRLSTNVSDYVDPGTNPGIRQIRMSAEMVVQLDFYGANAMQYGTAVTALFRDGYGVDAFPRDIAPLYAGDAMQLPLITGEDAWLERWKLELHLQVNQHMSVSQDFAESLEIGTAGNPVTADTTAPQGWNGLKEVDLTFR